MNVTVGFSVVCFLTLKNVGDVEKNWLSEECRGNLAGRESYRGVTLSSPNIYHPRAMDSTTARAAMCTYDTLFFPNSTERPNAAATVPIL